MQGPTTTCDNCGQEIAPFAMYKPDRVVYNKDGTVQRAPSTYKYSCERCDLHWEEEFDEDE